MKRTADGEVIDVFHPQVAFHREVLIAEQWATIRADFLAALNSRPHELVWQEPKKLWRYSQEALGKWVLSQVARMPADEDMRAVFFFPSARLFDTIPVAKRSAGKQSYNEQLLRDLSMKSNGVTDAKAVRAIADILDGFNLAQRCATAEAAVAERMAQLVRYDGTFRPVVRRLEEEDPTRTPSQKRIHGPLIEIKVQLGEARQRAAGRGHGQPRVSASVPLAAWDKLLRTYAHVSADAEAAQYPRLRKEALAEFRAATVVLRYEATLSTGSLQLCADTSLKQHLHAAGYHVMDLCASPINAYMGCPKPGRFSPTVAGGGDDDGGAAPPASPVDLTRPSSLEEEVEHPNAFCSAFYDTDRFFGSLGSALHVDPVDMYRSTAVNHDRRPLLLTLDVPYDEDLCEELFQKLVRDMAKQQAAGHAPDEGATTTTTVGDKAGATSGVHVDYVLVLPVWWDVPVPLTKQYFTDAVEAGSAEEAAMVKGVVADRTAALQEGYRVSYTWPADLGKACTTAAGDNWACFDGLFIGGQYSYFCTNTNRWLRGVTATEVIALAQPTSRMLRDALTAYYGRV